MRSRCNSAAMFAQSSPIDASFATDQIARNSKRDFDSTPLKVRPLPVNTDKPSFLAMQHRAC